MLIMKQINHLIANAAAVEATTTFASFTDTGFTINTSAGYANASGGTYIYMAFADTRDYQWNFDSSGNKNNWTPNNINSNASSETTYDLMSDTPSLADEDTGNFATWNGVAIGTDATLSNGNLKIVLMVVALELGMELLQHYGYEFSGKWYWKK